MISIPDFQIPSEEKDTEGEIGHTPEKNYEIWRVFLANSIKKMSLHLIVIKEIRVRIYEQIKYFRSESEESRLCRIL